MKISDKYILIFIFLLTLAFRLFFVFQSNNFSDDVSYFHLRQIESIKETGKPIFNDDLSYSGRTFLFSPLFHYILLFFNLVFGDTALKIIPPILISLLVFIVYLIAREITKDKTSIFFSIFIVSFIPILISETLNKISVYALAIPIIFFMFFCLLKIEIKKYQYLFIFLLFFLSFLHLIAFVFALSLLFYMLISNIESVSLGKLKREVILFSIFLIILVQFVVHRSAFIFHGINLISLNIPGAIQSSYFRDFNIIDTALGIGVFPLTFGIYGIIVGVFKQRKDAALLLSGLILATTLLLSFKLIGFSTGLVFLGIPLAILASAGFENFFTYVSITKFAKISDRIAYILFILILSTFIFSIFSAVRVTNNSISEDEINSLEWIKDNTDQDSVILASINEGNLINAIAKRKNVIDSDFLLVKDANERYNDVEFIFKSVSLVKALQLLKEYNVDYIYFSDRAKVIYNINKLAYIDEECFKLVKETEKTKIYRVRRC